MDWARLIRGTRSKLSAVASCPATAAMVSASADSTGWAGWRKDKTTAPA